MSVHTLRRSRSLASLTTDLALAAPQVVAYRVGRMAMAGAAPSQRDRDEFKLMSEEKVAAFQESWTAMATQAIQVQQQLAMDILQAFWFPLNQQAPTLRSVERQWSRASIGILGKGLEPISRRAVDNARRLSEL